MLPGLGIQVLAVVLREYAAVFEPLVAFVRYVPLKGKMFFHLDLSVPSANSIALAGKTGKLFVPGAAGRTAGRGLFFGLVPGAAG